MSTLGGAHGWSGLFQCTSTWVKYVQLDWRAAWKTSECTENAARWQRSTTWHPMLSEAVPIELAVIWAFSRKLAFQLAGFGRWNIHRVAVQWLTIICDPFKWDAAFEGNCDVCKFWWCHCRGLQPPLKTPLRHRLHVDGSETSILTLMLNETLRIK